jgi:hypothetical protein
MLLCLWCLQKKGTGLAAEVQHFFSTYQKHQIFRGLVRTQQQKQLHQPMEQHIKST